MARIAFLTQVINDAVKRLAQLFQKKAPRKNVHLSLECLEDKLLLTGMALMPQRPLLNDGGVLTEFAFTPFGFGFGVFHTSDAYSTSNQGTFSYVEHGYLTTSFGSGTPVDLFDYDLASEYTITFTGTRSGNSFSYSGSVEYTYDISEISLSGDAEVSFTQASGYAIDNILFTSLMSSVLHETDPGFFTGSSYLDIYSYSSGSFSYSYEYDGVSSVSGSGSNQVPYLPLGLTGVDSYQYSGAITYTIDKTGSGTSEAENWFKIDGAGSYSTLPDDVLALVCYAYAKDASLSMSSTATALFSANGTSSLIFSTQETFSANGSQAGGSYSYSNNYASSGRETYAYSGTLTQLYSERAQGSWSEDSAGTYSYSGSTPTHTSLQDALVETAGGTYSLNNYEQRAMSDGTGQRLSTYSADALTSTSNGKLLTEGSGTSESRRGDSYSFSGTASSTTSYAGTATSTWNRPQSFTQSETYTYSASYQENRSGSGSSLQTTESSIEAGSTFSHSGFTFTQEGRIDNRELQSRSYSESASRTSSSSGLGSTSLYQGGMPASGSPSLSSFAYSATGTNSLLSYQSTETMNFSGSASARETYSSNDTATLNRQSPFLETITSSAYSTECYTSNSTFHVTSGLLQRSSLASYTETFSFSAQGTYASESYSLSCVTFDSTATGSHYYSETQSYNISTGSFNGTFSSNEQSTGTLSAAGPATVLGTTTSNSSLNATSSYSYQGSSSSHALVSTQYSESHSRRGNYSHGSYSYGSLEYHADGVRNLAFESTAIREITSGLATYMASSGATYSSSETSGNNGLISTISGSNIQSSTGTATLFFTQYNILNREGSSRITFSHDEYGSASHLTLSLTSINYSEEGSGFVTSTFEQRNYSTSLLTASENFSYGASSSISLTDSATGIVYHSSVRSGDAAGCITSSSAGRFRYQESRTTLTSTQVTDYVYANQVLGEYLDGEYSFSSMAYESNASISSLSTYHSLDTLANGDRTYLRDALPTGNSSNITSDAHDGAVASATSSSIGDSASTTINDLLYVSASSSTSASSHLETYSSLGVYSNFSTSITSFAHHSTGQSMSTMSSIEALTGSIVETALTCHSLSDNTNAASGGPIQSTSGGSGDERLTSSTTTISYSEYVIARNAYSQMEYEVHQEGEIPFNYETDLSLYESILSAAAQFEEAESGAIVYAHIEEQSSGVVTDSAGGALIIPGSTDTPYSSSFSSQIANHTISVEFASTQAIARLTAGQQTTRSYEYGTYSDGDYNLTSASYFQNTSSSSAETYSTSSESDITIHEVSSSSQMSNYIAGSVGDPHTLDVDVSSHVTNLHTEKEESISYTSTQSSTQLQRGVYSHGSYSFGCIAYDSALGSSSAKSSSTTSSSSTTQAGRQTVVDIVATLGLWDLYNTYGFVMSGWYYDFSESLSATNTSSATTTNSESYAQSIRGTSSGYDYSFSLISSTYDAATTSTYSQGSTVSSSIAGTHTTGVEGVYRSISGEFESGVSSLGTSTFHFNKQHVGAMINGVATILYDKTTVDTSNSSTSGSYNSTTIEGSHADFDVYSYNYSGITITAGQSTHDYSQIAFDPTSGNPWSLVSYNSIVTVSNGVSNSQEQDLDLNHTWTNLATYSSTTTTYHHVLHRDESQSSLNTVSQHVRGHSTPDGSGGYSFVFDHYSLSATSSDTGEYHNVGYADRWSTITSGMIPTSSFYSHYDWNKERLSTGTYSETLTGETSGATFNYTGYSVSQTQDDHSEFTGVSYYYESNWGDTSWSRDTLTYEETMGYEYTANTAGYTYSIDYQAPWTWTTAGYSPYFGSYGPSYSAGNVSHSYDDDGEEAKEIPAPVDVKANVDGAKLPEYYGLGAGVVASYADDGDFPLPTIITHGGALILGAGVGSAEGQKPRDVLGRGNPKGRSRDSYVGPPKMNNDTERREEKYQAANPPGMYESGIAEIISGRAIVDAGGHLMDGLVEGTRYLMKLGDALDGLLNDRSSPKAKEALEDTFRDYYAFERDLANGWEITKQDWTAPIKTLWYGFWKNPGKGLAAAVPWGFAVFTAFRPLGLKVYSELARIRYGLNSDIALGIVKDRWAPPEAYGLKKFAAEREFLTASEVEHMPKMLEGVPRGDWPATFNRMMNASLESQRKVHFELSGLNIAEALAGDATVFMGRYTAWELQQIVKNPAWFKNTIFYLNGKVLTAQQLAKLGILRHYISNIFGINF